MYEEMLKTLLAYIEALNKADAEMGEYLSDKKLPGVYLDRIPVMYEEDLVGWLVDEVGGSWSYREATTEEMDSYKK